PTASLCHGFSATPTYQLSRRVLGVAPAAPGFARVALAPDLAGLDHAAGVVPTPHGDVEARLERAGDGFVARYRLPDGLTASVTPARGFVLLAEPDRLQGEIELRFERDSAAV
ncbi:MAG TPA: alpha-L-rhamnosidase C-terminal domain-containing protein, partial [Caulobacteraceae bacterium]|nr:alpha-L-rhamnosidase C-terminal domain-containing protein [Caulobacteraceae bacterium]